MRKKERNQEVAKGVRRTRFSHLRHLIPQLKTSLPPKPPEKEKTMTENGNVTGLTSSVKDIQVDGKENVDYLTPMTVTSQFYFHGIPFRLDTYRGCSHMCQYCFANTRKSGTGFGSDFQPACAKIDYFQKVFKKAFDTEKEFADVNIEALRHRTPIHFGGMSDPFQHREKDIGISYEVLKLLKEYDYPVVISTKNTMFTEDKYMKVLADLKCVMQVSIINNTEIRDLEPGASGVEERFKAVKQCCDAGIHAHIRLQPYIPGFIQDVDEYIKKIRDTGCRFLTIEHLKLPLDYAIIGQISKVLGYDVKAKFQEFGGMMKPYGREFELSGAIKHKLLFKDGLVDKLHKNGIKFGAGDNQLHHFNDVGTCCGVDQYKGFENVFKANYTWMFSTNKEKQEFTFDDLLKDHWLPQQEINDNMNRPKDRWRHDNPCRYKDDGSVVSNLIYYHLRNKWHNPQLNDSPTDLYLINYRKEHTNLVDKISGKLTGIPNITYFREKEKKGLEEWL
jgi:DNA repair photolyase